MRMIIAVVPWPLSVLCASSLLARRRPDSTRTFDQGVSDYLSTGMNHPTRLNALVHALMAF